MFVLTSKIPKFKPMLKFISLKTKIIYEGFYDYHVNHGKILDDNKNVIGTF